MQAFPVHGGTKLWGFGLTPHGDGPSCEVQIVVQTFPAFKGAGSPTEHPKAGVRQTAMCWGNTIQAKEEERKAP